MQTEQPQPTNEAADGASGVARVVRRGQLIRLKNYGLVRFDRLDFFMGQCTARLTGIDYQGTYYPLPEELEREGLTIIDA